MQAIVRYRKERGMSQSQFAEALGVSLSTVFRWETGRQCPGMEMIRRIALVCGCNVSDILDPPPPPAREGRGRKRAGKLTSTP